MSSSRRYAAPPKKEGWLSIQWDPQWPDDRSKKPSALHGILDQLTGRLVNDPHLKEQGRREFRKAAEYKQRMQARSGGDGKRRGGGILAALFAGGPPSPAPAVKSSHSSGARRSNTTTTTRATPAQRDAYNSSRSRPSARRTQTSPNPPVMSRQTSTRQTTTPHRSASQREPVRTGSSPAVYRNTSTARRERGDGRETRGDRERTGHQSTRRRYD